jgi:lysophospholipase L1-like esterase
MKRWECLICACLAVVIAQHGRSNAMEPVCASADCVNLVFDGDSISAGAGSTQGHGLDAQVAETVGSNVRSNNVAVGGRPVSDCLRLYPKLVAPLFSPASHHNVIVFHAGDNDIAQGRDAAQTYAAFTAYVSMAHQQGWKIVVSTELRSPHFPPSQEAQLEQYNDSLRQNRAGADAVVDFDTDARLTTMSNRFDPSMFKPDGLHPTDAGYAILTQMLAPAVRRVAGR